MLNIGARVLVLVLVESKVLVVVVLEVLDFLVRAVVAVVLDADDRVVVTFVLDEVVLMVWLENEVGVFLVDVRVEL